MVCQKKNKVGSGRVTPICQQRNQKKQQQQQQQQKNIILPEAKYN